MTLALASRTQLTWKPLLSHHTMWVSSRSQAIYYIRGIVHESPKHSSPLRTILVACKKMCASHRVTGLKKLMVEYFFIYWRQKGVAQNQGNNLSLHHLWAFVATLWRMNISRGACSTWTDVLLQMVYLTVGTTWSILYSLSLASNHVDYNATYKTIHNCSAIIMVYI